MKVFHAIALLISIIAATINIIFSHFDHHFAMVVIYCYTVAMILMMIKEILRDKIK